MTKRGPKESDQNSEQRPTLVTREGLIQFTHRVVELFHPEFMMLFGSLTRADSTWDSDADILVVMHFEGRPFEKAVEIRAACKPNFPLDLIVHRPEEIWRRYDWGDPIMRAALDGGVLLHPAEECRPDGLHGEAPKSSD